MAGTKEADLYALAAQAGSPDAASEEGVPNGRVFLTEEEVGYETRVKPPSTKKAASKPPAKETGGKKPLARGSVADKNAADIAETLEEKTTVIFALLAGVTPVTSAYAVENSPKAIRALIDIGKRRPAVMKALVAFANGADGMEVGKFILGILVAIQVDFGRLNGDELPARAFGVTQIIVDHFSDDVPSAPNPNVMGQMADGQRFTPVS